MRAHHVDDDKNTGDWISTEKDTEPNATMYKRFHELTIVTYVYHLQQK